jgi:uncharacterized membrane protein YedE/YeeE
MTVDIHAFTPGAALVGGLIIGVAAAILLLFNGRVAGISGVLGGLLRPKPGDTGWRLAFVLGLLAAPMAYQIFAALPESRIEVSDAMIIVAGLCVGAGSRYGGGCTSGHGVCGLSRFSGRSLVATVTFMATGFVTVFVVRHLVAAL